MSAVRRAAYAALMDITERGAYANLRLKSLPEALNAQERARVCAMVYTTLDHLLYIDFLLAHYAKGSLKPPIRCILRLGVCELLYMRTPAHAAVSGAVSLAKALGKGALGGFINGVLRSVERGREAPPPLPAAPAERLSVQYSYPRWLVEQWLAQYGEAFTEALLGIASTPLEVRPQYPFTADALAAALPVRSRRGQWDENCLVLEHGFRVDALPEFLDGRMSVQSQSAMLVCRALGDCRGKRVLDACAAPGGKSAYIASLAENDVALTCLELHEHRIALLKRTLERLRVRAELRRADASKPIDGFAQAFDAVLVDAPCSGLGLMGDKPDVRYAKSDADVVALSQLQREILSACAAYPRAGGALVYATCTISCRENEQNVEWFLSQHPNYRLEPMPIPIENQGSLQLFPHIHGSDGFYLARMKRCS